MAQIVGKRDCFCQIFVQPQRTRDGAANRRHLDRMRQARAQMVAGAVEQNMRFVLQAAKRARMNAARSVRPIFEQTPRALRALPPPFVRASSSLRSFTYPNVEEPSDFG